MSDELSDRTVEGNQVDTDPECHGDFPEQRKPGIFEYATALTAAFFGVLIGMGIEYHTVWDKAFNAGEHSGAQKVIRALMDGNSVRMGDSIFYVAGRTQTRVSPEFYAKLKPNPMSSTLSHQHLGYDFPLTGDLPGTPSDVSRKRGQHGNP